MPSLAKVCPLLACVLAACIDDPIGGVGGVGGAIGRDAGPSGPGPVDGGQSEQADGGVPDAEAGAADMGVADTGVLPECFPLDVPIGTGAPSAAATNHRVRPTAFADELSAPYPTNAWWGAILVGDGDLPMNGLPYLLQAADGLNVSAPRLLEQPREILSEFVVDWRLTGVGGVQDRQIVAYDPLSVTIRWSAQGGSVEAPLVRGMPYATMRYANATPRLQTPHGIASVDGGTAGTVDGESFAVALDNGQQWRVYASEPLSLRIESNALVATEPFSGFVRVAWVSDGTDPSVLDASASAVPVAGQVNLTGCSDEGRIEFVFESEGQGSLLMMGLPHHRMLLGEDEVRADLDMDTVRGRMFGVIGDEWSLTLPLDPGGFDAPRQIAAERVSAVRAALMQDQDLINSSSGPYFGGKQVAAMGRLALIADTLGEQSIARGIRGRLADRLGPWFDGTMPRLRYEQTWGGIVAAGANQDPGRFFGQGYYNDHHFHYGYHLYAAAALAKTDADWARSHRDNVDALARDIANPSSEDAFFTPFRSMDWYAGHSWATGLFPFPRNQESTSEAVNAWYALALWGEVTGRAAIERLGRLMTAQEILATQTYWQIEPGSAVYGDGTFASNRVVGILFDTRAVYDTFFGDNVEFIHGIQYLPFTPVTERLLDPTWMQAAYPVVSTALTRVEPPIEPGWRGFIYMAHAVIEPEQAWQEVQTLTGYDDGNSRTNTLWWVATRP